MGKMKLWRAMQILIDHAARNVAGTGCGVRPEIKEKEIKEVREAIKRVWSFAYKHEFNEQEFYNRGI